MNDVVNKDDLFCDEYKAVILCEYNKEMEWLKRIIVMSHDAIKNNSFERLTFDSLRQMFAETIVQYSKMAYDNMVLGHFEATNMICRAIMENTVFLEIITEDKTDELWKYYVVQSWRDMAKKGKKYMSCLEQQTFKSMCDNYGISKAFFKRRKEYNYKAYIDIPYGWTYKVNKEKRISFNSVCKLVDETYYMGFAFMSEYSHGTSLNLKMNTSITMDDIVFMIINTYICLYRMVTLYCIDKVEDEFDEITDNIENFIYNYMHSCDWEQD